METSGTKGLNGDLLADTPPDPSTKFYQEKVDTDLCGGPESFKIAGKTFKPDRSNLMSYYRSCQPPATLTAGQIKVIKKTIQHKSWQHLIEASAGTRYAGVFRAGKDAHFLWVDVDWKSFEKKWKELSDKGLRLIDIETWMEGKTCRYAGVFRAGKDAHALWVGDDWDGFEKKWKELSDEGLRLIDIETWMEGKTCRYAGVFRAGKDAHALWVGDDWDGFEKKWKELSDKGLRLIDIETWMEGKNSSLRGGIPCWEGCPLLMGWRRLEELREEMEGAIGRRPPSHRHRDLDGG